MKSSPKPNLKSFWSLGLSDTLTIPDVVFELTMDLDTEKIQSPNNDVPCRRYLTGRKQAMRSSKQATNVASFHFVNVIKQPRHHASEQTAIRSQALRNFHRAGKEAELRRKDENKASPTTENSSETRHMFRLGPWDIQELTIKPRKPKTRRSGPGLVRAVQKISGNEDTPAPDSASQQQLVMAESPVTTADAISLPTSLFHTFDSRKIDPFDSLPIPMSDRTQFLLHYYEQDLLISAHLIITSATAHAHITSSPLMTYPKPMWFSLAFKDSAYLHAALSHYASHLTLSRQPGDPNEALWHRTEAVRVINERLSISNLATSNGTIGAISCMINYESNNGTMESVRTHVVGLEQIVKLRGGLQEEGFSTILHRLVC